MSYGTSRIFKHDHPQLLIVNQGGASLGRNFSQHYVRVTSLQPLSGKQLRTLREAGFLGYGQGFSFRQVMPDGTKVAVPDDLRPVTGHKLPHESGHHVVQCSEVDDKTGEVIRCPSINPYSEVEDKPLLLSYFEYEITNTIDSGD